MKIHFNILSVTDLWFDELLFRMDLTNIFLDTFVP